jgi:hypothetical protein
MDGRPAGETMRDLQTARDPAVTKGRPCHWTCAVTWVNEHQDQDAEHQPQAA